MLGFIAYTLTGVTVIQQDEVGVVRRLGAVLSEALGTRPALGLALGPRPARPAQAGPDRAPCRSVPGVRKGARCPKAPAPTRRTS